MGLGWTLHFVWPPCKIPKLGFKDLPAWIINGSSVYCVCMFDYILQPCLGQMASIMQGRPTGFLEVVLGLGLTLTLVHTSELVRVPRKHKFMEQVYSRVNLIVDVEYVGQLNWSVFTVCLVYFLLEPTLTNHG